MDDHRTRRSVFRHRRSSVSRCCTRSARWVLYNRSVLGGGFRHDMHDVAGPFLGDNAAMAAHFSRSFTCYRRSRMVTRAEAAAKFIQQNFRNPAGAGYLTSHTPTTALHTASGARRKRRGSALCECTRTTTPETARRDMAENAMRYLAAPSSQIVSMLPASCWLSANSVRRRCTSPSSDNKDDPAVQALFQAALCYPSSYKRPGMVGRARGPPAQSRRPLSRARPPGAFGLPPIAPVRRPIFRAGYCAPKGRFGSPLAPWRKSVQRDKRAGYRKTNFVPDGLSGAGRIILSDMLLPERIRRSGYWFGTRTPSAAKHHPPTAAPSSCFEATTRSAGALAPRATCPVLFRLCPPRTRWPVSLPSPLHLSLRPRWNGFIPPRRSRSLDDGHRGDASDPWVDLRVSRRDKEYSD